MAVYTTHTIPFIVIFRKHILYKNLQSGVNEFEACEQHSWIQCLLKVFNGQTECFVFVIFSAYFFVKNLKLVH